MTKIIYLILLNLLMLQSSYALEAFIHLQNNTRSELDIISKAHFFVHGQIYKLSTNEFQVITVPIGENVKFKINKIVKNGKDVDPLFFQICHNGYTFKLKEKQTATISIYLNRGFIDDGKYYVCDISIK